MTEELDELEVSPAPRPSIKGIVLRVVLVVGALAVSAFVLLTVFDDLSWSEISDALRSLSDAEIVALLSMWVLWIATQGLQTSSLIPGLPVRRGVTAFLGPAAIASVIPGPSDLPLRLRMFTSWGFQRSEATLAVTAGGVFSIGIKLVLPVIAAVGLLVSGAPIEGTLRTIVLIALVVGVGMTVIAAVLGSERRTASVGRLLEPVWRLALRLLRRQPTGDELAARLVEHRARSLDTLRERWAMAAWGTCLSTATRFALLLMSVRFTGVTEELASWPQVFVAYALMQGLTVIPLTAGDAGVSEVALISFLTAATGAGAVNEVTAGVILFRLLTWLVIIPVGLAALGVWRHSLRRTTEAPSVVE